MLPKYLQTYTNLLIRLRLPVKRNEHVYKQNNESTLNNHNFNSRNYCSVGSSGEIRMTSSHHSNGARFPTSNKHFVHDVVFTRNSLHTSCGHRLNLSSKIYGDNKYKILGSKDIQALTDIVGPDAVVTDTNELLAYNTDWTHTCKGDSKLVLKPKEAAHVPQILKYCNENQIAICIQGGNTGLVKGSIPVNDEVILSTSRMNKIISFDEISGILISEPGCILQTLDDYISNFGYTMPLDLGAKGTCQIGGNISTNAGGLHVIRYGTLHGSVLGLEVVLASGQKLDLMSNLRKDNTGYDLKHLFIGAEGTLGIVTRVCIVCPQKPEEKCLTLVGLDSMENVLNTYRLAKSQLNEVLHAVEFMDSAAMALVEEVFDNKSPIAEFPFYMLVEAAGSRNSHVESRMTEFVSNAMERGLILDGTLTSESVKMQRIWSMRERVTEAGQNRGQVLKYDLSLPLDNFYTPVIETKRRFGSKAKYCMGYGHIGDGNLHLNVVVDEKTDELIALAEPFVYELTSKFRGSISAEHGLGALKNRYIGYSKSSESIEYMKKLKQVFDPNGILNPWKTLPP